MALQTSREVGSMDTGSSWGWQLADSCAGFKLFIGRDNHHLYATSFQGSVSAVTEEAEIVGMNDYDMGEFAL